MACDPELVFEAPRPALHAVLDQVRVHELDHPCVVVAVREIMVQRGEAVLLTGALHRRQLSLVELGTVDIAPVVR